MIRLPVRAALLPFASAALASAPLAILRSDLAGLPESIGRETAASIDRACDSLRAGGLAPAAWTAALADPEDAPLRAAALAAVEARLPQPWEPWRMREAAFALLGCAFAGETAPPGLVARLSRAPLGKLEPATCALALVALDAAGGDTAAAWDALARRPVPRSPSVAEVAAAALARAARARRLSPAGAGGEPPADVLAHVRWIAARLRLGYGSSGDPAHPLDPETALLVAVLGSSLPRRALAEDPTLLPFDWRNHLADRLLALQVCTEPGVFLWLDPDPDGDDFSATAEAVLALRLLSAR